MQKIFLAGGGFESVWCAAYDRPRPSRAAPTPRHRLPLARPDADRRLLGKRGLEALARAVLDPRLLGLRSEPTRVEDVRDRRERAPRRGLPQQRRRDQGDGDQTGDRGGSEAEPRLARQLLLLDRQ